MSCSAASICRHRYCRSDPHFVTHRSRISDARPVQLRFKHAPSAIELRRTIDERIPADGYFDDVHGSAAYKRHLTRYFAEQIRAELAQPGARK